MVPNREAYRALKPNAKVVYVALCDYADETGTCWPSRRTVAKDTGLSLSSVDRSLRELVKAGVIEKQTRIKDNGDNASNVYQIMIVATDEGGVTQTPPGVTAAQGGLHTDTQTITSELQPKNDKSLTDVSEAPPVEYGDPTINQMLRIFEEHNGVKLKNIKKQRNAASRIIKRCGSNEKAVGVCQAAVACQSDRYAPAIANLLDLDDKLDKLATYYRKRNTKSPTVKTGVVV